MSNEYTVKDCIELYKIMGEHQPKLAEFFYNEVIDVLRNKMVNNALGEKDIQISLRAFFRKAHYRRSVTAEAVKSVFDDDITIMPLKVFKPEFKLIALWRLKIGK